MKKTLTIEDGGKAFSLILPQPGSFEQSEKESCHPDKLKALQQSCEAFLFLERELARWRKEMKKTLTIEDGGKAFSLILPQSGSFEQSEKESDPSRIWSKHDMNKKPHTPKDWA